MTAFFRLASKEKPITKPHHTLWQAGQGRRGRQINIYKHCNLQYKPLKQAAHGRPCRVRKLKNGMSTGQVTGSSKDQNSASNAMNQFAVESLRQCKER